MSNQLSQEVEILNETGVHARPATYLVGVVRKLSSSITLSKGGDVARGKSLIEILGLSLAKGDRVVITAEGDNAQSDLDIVVGAFKSGLGENVTEVSSSAIQEKHVHNSGRVGVISSLECNEELAKRIFSKEQGVLVNGITIYSSVVVGKAYILKEQKFEVVEDSKLSVEEEKSRFAKASAEVSEALRQLIKTAQEEGKSSQAEIFAAHLEVLSDDFLLKTIEKHLQEGKTADYAVQLGAGAMAGVLKQTGNPLLQERVADVKDIEKHLLTILSGGQLSSVAIPEGAVVIAEDLTPSAITSLSGAAKAVVLARGSATSHISIMMKNEGIPSMVAAGMEILSITNGTSLILKGHEGTLEINPSEGKVLATEQQVCKLATRRQENLSNAKVPSVTQDGLEIRVLGNVGDLTQAEKAHSRGAQGIGLVRTEFLFMNSASCPTEEEQSKMYQDICNAMKGDYVVFRTLDVGGDKPISYINIPKEENPIVGLRGVRNYDLNKDVVESQLKALLKIKPAGVCKIMAPMVSSVPEVLAFKEWINNIKKELGVDTKIEVGIMVEVPSVALMSKQFAAHVDFFSIGTNDLTQYLLAIDRGHGLLTKQLSNLNPALLQAIAMTCEGAEAYGVKVGVCGAMASELECIPLLIGLGVNNLSCSAELIPDAKALIRSLTVAKCQEVAKKATMLSDPEAVKELVFKEFGDLL